MYKALKTRKCDTRTKMTKNRILIYQSPVWLQETVQGSESDGKTIYHIVASELKDPI